MNGSEHVYNLFQTPCKFYRDFYVLLAYVLLHYSSFTVCTFMHAYIMYACIHKIKFKNTAIRITYDILEFIALYNSSHDKSGTFSYNSFEQVNVRWNNMPSSN